MRAGGGLGPRAAAELPEHVPDVHLHRARAEHELARDLRVRPADGDEAEHLELAPRETAAFELAGRAASEPAVDRLAELLQQRRGAGRERAGADELARRSSRKPPSFARPLRQF